MDSKQPMHYFHGGSVVCAVASQQGGAEFISKQGEGIIYVELHGCLSIYVCTVMNLQPFQGVSAFGPVT